MTDYTNLDDVPRKHQEGAKLFLEHIKAYEENNIACSMADMVMLANKYDAPAPVFEKGTNKIIGWRC